ncbi:hypothetical protein HUJ05_007177 [Dendroctonus ponderosae]|nr:hypothetical protein HUJ05_007177 [Dendroctonus ponderosae]
METLKMLSMKNTKLRRHTQLGLAALPERGGTVSTWLLKLEQYCSHGHGAWNYYSTKNNYVPTTTHVISYYSSDRSGMQGKEWARQGCGNQALHVACLWQFSFPCRYLVVCWMVGKLEDRWKDDVSFVPRCSHLRDNYKNFEETFIRQPYEFLKNLLTMVKSFKAEFSRPSQEIYKQTRLRQLLVGL